MHHCQTRKLAVTFQQLSFEVEIFDSKMRLKARMTGPVRPHEQKYSTDNSGTVLFTR
jgi:hypothetical protein